MATHAANTEKNDVASRGGPQAFDPTVPNVARIYDFLLDGKDNYAADRDAARRLLDAVPGTAVAARHNRRFLVRAVHFVAGEAGIRQFLDVGPGLPTRGNVHEAAQAVSRRTRGNPAHWRGPIPHRKPTPALFYAGVARKPGGAREAAI